MLGTKEELFPIRRPHLVEVCTGSRLPQDIGSKLFRIIVSAVSYRPARRSSKLFSHPVSSCLCRRRYQELYFFRFQLGQNLVVHRITGSSLLFFCRTELITPIRHCSINTELIYRMNYLEQELSVHQISVEVKGCFTFLLIQDSTTQGTDTLEYRMTSFFEWLQHFVGCTLPLPFFEREKNFHTTSLPTLDPRMSNVFARI